MDVLGGTEISSEVLTLIEEAKQILILVSPYFDPWERLSTEIKRAATRSGMKVMLLLRGGEDRAKQEERARGLAEVGVRMMFLSKLHAKVYISESQAIVTSMNLLKSSALDSWELAIRVNAKEDSAIFSKIVTHVKDLMDRAKDERELAAKVKAATNVAGLATMLDELRSNDSIPRLTSWQGRAKTGYCIRCGVDIAFNPSRPLCADCFKAWAKFENPDYQESHCHACGKERSTRSRNLFAGSAGKQEPNS